MCYAIPGEVVELEGATAVVDYFGEKRQVRADLLEVDVGDYVYAQGGFVVEKIGGRDAREVLAVWKELLERLTEKDLQYSRRRHAGDARLEELFSKAGVGGITREDMIFLLHLTEKDDLQALYEAANHLRQKRTGNSCCVHGIIEFSNHCVKDCHYCGIRAENDSITRYRMSVDEIVDAAENAVDGLGFKALVLQSGDDPAYTTEGLVEVIEGIREKTSALLFMSVGERSLECYGRMYDAGARGVLLRFETSNQGIYDKLHTSSSYEARLRLLREVHGLGYITATGGLVGLPDQSVEDVADDILLAKTLGPEMYSFGPFIPHPNTPLSEHEPVDLDTILKATAVMRLCIPDARILVTTAVETLFREGARETLLAGANSMMINVTPLKYRKHYCIYPHKKGVAEDTRELIREKVQLLQSLGRAPTDLGFVYTS